MSPPADLQALERKIYLSYHQDGILNLVIGAVIVFLGLSEVTSSSIGNVLAILLVVAYFPLKQIITVPRLGYVRFKSNRGGVNLPVAGGIILAVLFLLLIAMLVVLFTNAAGSSPLLLWIRRNPLLLYALLGCVGFGLASLLTGLKRLLWYALATFSILLAGHLLQLPLFVPLMFLGVGILLVGTFLLVRFLRQYPAGGGEDHAGK
jgi:hypothetical protein